MHLCRALSFCPFFPFLVLPLPFHLFALVVFLSSLRLFVLALSSPFLPLSRAYRQLFVISISHELDFCNYFGSHVEVVFGHFWDHFWSLLGPLGIPLDIHGPSVLHVCSHVYTCRTHGSFLGPLLGPLWRPTATPSGQEEDQSRSQDGSREGSQKELRKASILETLEHAILNDSTTV